MACLWGLSSPVLSFYPMLSVPKQHSKQCLRTLNTSTETITVAFELYEHKEVLDTFLSVGCPCFADRKLMLYLKVSLLHFTDFEHLPWDRLNLLRSVIHTYTWHFTYKIQAQLPEVLIKCECSIVQHISHQSSELDPRRKNLHYIQLGTKCCIRYSWVLNRGHIRLPKEQMKKDKCLRIEAVSI